MNTLEFDTQRAELARRILNESDEQVMKELIRFFSNTKSSAEQKPFSKKVTFDSIAIDTRGYKFNRDEANAR
jgi:hypothetical protein